MIIVLAHYSTGDTASFLFDGDEMHNGKMETELDRAKRFIKDNKNIMHYEIRES